MVSGPVSGFESHAKLRYFHLPKNMVYFPLFVLKESITIGHVFFRRA